MRHAWGLFYHLLSTHSCSNLVAVKLTTFALDKAIAAERGPFFDHEGGPGSVAEEMKAGYKLFDKVIRPARVKISKGPMRSEKSEFHPNAPNN